LPQKEIIETTKFIKDGKTKNWITKYKILGHTEIKKTDGYLMYKFVVSDKTNRRSFFTYTVENTRITFTIEGIDREAENVPFFDSKYFVSEVYLFE